MGVRISHTLHIYIFLFLPYIINKGSKMKVCEYCNLSHRGSYGSGRFCSKKCARGFSTKEKRKEINFKVSRKLKGRPPSHDKNFTCESIRNKAINSTKTYWKMKILEKPFELLCKQSQRKVLRMEQNDRCAKCNNQFYWMNERITPELHHKDGNNMNKNKENSELLCPNCHSITDNYMFKHRKHSLQSRKKISEGVRRYLMALV